MHQLRIRFVVSVRLSFRVLDGIWHIGLTKAQQHTTRDLQNTSVWRAMHFATLCHVICFIYDLIRFNRKNSLQFQFSSIHFNVFWNINSQTDTETLQSIRQIYLHTRLLVKKIRQRIPLRTHYLQQGRPSTPTVMTQPSLSFPLPSPSALPPF